MREPADRNGLHGAENKEVALGFFFVNVAKSLLVAFGALLKCAAKIRVFAVKKRCQGGIAVFDAVLARVR